MNDCALSTAGALTANEWKQLAEHVRWCDACRQEVHKYKDIATTAMALLAPNDPGLDVENEWSPEMAVAKFMKRLRDEESVMGPPAMQRAWSFHQSFRRLPRFNVALRYAEKHGSKAKPSVPTQDSSD